MVRQATRSVKTCEEYSPPNIWQRGMQGSTDCAEQNLKIQNSMQMRFNVITLNVMNAVTVKLNGDWLQSSEHSFNGKVGGYLLVSILGST